MSVDFIKRLSDSVSLTDILIQMESFLDDLDIYVFKNWFDGELADGPIVERHWVSMALKYDYKNMPDPEGGIRLLKYGAIVKFTKTQEEDTEDTKEQDIRDINSRLAYGTINDAENAIDQPKPKLKTIWLVTIKIPRHFIEELQQMDDFLDDNIDAEHVQAAKDSDLQAKDAYSNNSQDDSQATQDELTGEVDQQATADVGA
jgi:hypothetical protein